MTDKKVLFLQLEIFLDCAPHMGMCLFLNDVRRQGIDCTKYLVNCNHMEDLFAVIDQESFHLICLDSSFTVDLVNEIMSQCPGIPVLAGGVNALSLFLHTDLPFAVFGPGRKAATVFMDQFFGKQDFYEVPNLFFKVGDCIHYSNQTQLWDLPAEILPYTPDLEWGYLGPRRKNVANTEAVSIIAGTGCPHSKTKRSKTRYDVNGAVRSLGYDITEKANKRMEDIFNQGSHGCSFCIFQLQELTVYPVSQTIDLLLKQARHLYETFDTRAFCIQTENPFPFLHAFLLQLVMEEIPVEFISLRTRPDILLKQRKKLEKALDVAHDRGFHVSIEEIGFETFVEEELALFEKGVDVETNIQALETLRSFKQKYGDIVSIHVGHGIILFHPWSTAESIIKTLEVMVRYPDVFPRFYPNRLTLYSEFLPLFQMISSKKLLRKADASYGWDFESVDPVAEQAFELYMILYSAFGPDMAIDQYLEAIQCLGTQSLETILEEKFGLVPDDDQ